MSDYIWEKVQEEKIKEELPTKISQLENDVGYITTAEFDAHKAESASKHITESGENENGRYIKFDDGTMICRGETTVTAQINTAWGSVYYYTIGRLTFPHAFVEIPYVIPLNLSDRSIILDTYGVRQTNTGVISIYRPIADNQEYVYRVGYIAIGRWK